MYHAVANRHIKVQIGRHLAQWRGMPIRPLSGMLVVCGGGSHSLQQGLPMDKTVADLNIAHFKRLLESEIDADKRKTLLQLLAEEEAKLTLLTSDSRSSRPPSR
jgi:hypothetical protein